MFLVFIYSSRAEQSIVWVKISEIAKGGVYKNHGIQKNEIVIGIINDQKNILKRDLFLRINNPHINKIILTSKCSSNVLMTGDVFDFKNRPVIFNDFLLPLNSSFTFCDTVFLTLNKKNENLSYHLEIVKKSDLPTLQLLQSFSLGASIILIVIVIIYFIILGLISRKNYNYIFAAYIFSIGIWFLNNGGFLYQYLWPNNPDFHNISRTLFSTIGITLFSLFILDYYSDTQNILYKIITYIIYIFMPVRILALLIPNTYEGPNDLKFGFLVVNALVLTILFVGLIGFIVTKTFQKGKWSYSIGFLLYAISLFIEVSHQYSFDPMPLYHQSVFFPFLFLIGQIILIGIGNLMTILKTNKLIAENNFQDLINVDNDLAQKIISAQEFERFQIGEHIHDTIGSELSIIKVKVETLQKKYTDFSGMTDLMDIRSLMNNVIREVRFIITNLISAHYDFTNSNDLLNTLQKQYQSVASFTIHISNTEDIILTDNLGIHMYRILNELLTNTIKHSSCTIVKLKITLAENHLIRITYSENTKGLAFTSEPQKYGLKNMMHRINYLKGKFEKVDTNDSMIITIEIPV